MPDFQEVYGLRLTEVVRTWEPVEVVLLIAGLPGTSRYAARLAGEENGRGWELANWLALDMRNALEGLRATVVSMASGKDKNTFREWNNYPGYNAMQTRKHKSTLARLESMATPVTK